ncbi:MAG: O-antigen ligase family protein [Syntrophales bacterium]
MNRLTHADIDSKTILLLIMVVVVTLAGGLLIAKASTGVAFTVIAAVVIGIVSFINTEIALYILIISMLLGPQFIVGEPTELPGRGRPFTLRMDDFLLVIIGLSWFLKTAIRKELGLFTRTPLNGPIAYYFVVCLISTLFGYMMGRVKGITGFFFLLKYFEYFIIYFIAVNHLRGKKQIERFLFTILVVCFVVCIVAIYQVPVGGRVSAPFEGPEGEPNTLGGYLVLMLSIVLGLLLSYDGSRKQKIFLGTLSFFILISLAATLSRASWVSLIPMVMSLLYFSKRKWPIIVALIIIVLVSSFILPKSVKERVSFTFTQPKEQGQITVGTTRLDTSTSSRVQSWKDVLEKDFVSQPILGYGITGYRFLDAQYPRVLAETGLLGFITFFILLFSIYMNALYTYRGTADSLFSGLSLGYLAGFTAMVTHGIGTNTFIIVRIMEPFWFLTAMIIMIPSIEATAYSVISKESDR